MAVNPTAENSSTLLEPRTLAARLAGAASEIPAPQPALTRFFNRFLGKPNDQPARLPSGLEPDTAAGLASAMAAALRDSDALVTAATFQPENIRLQPALTGWQVFLGENPAASPALDNAGQQAAFTHLLYKIISGQNLPGDMSGKRQQISYLATSNAELSKVLDKGLIGGFTSLDALAGGFGWSLYRKTHLNFPVLLPAQSDKPASKPVSRITVRAEQLPEETSPKAASNRAWGGPLALVSLIIALVLLAGTILLSVGGLDKQYRQQSNVLPTSTAFPTAVPPTPTPAVALQTTRQADGASVTRYNAALDETAGNTLADPAKLAAGQVVSFNGYDALQIQSVKWSDDGSKVNLSLKNGGWETWDVASKQRLSRKELPNTEQYLAVSWSPDGQSFVAVGLDGQLRLGKSDRVLKTVNLNLGATAGTFSTYPWPFSWSPDSAYLLLVAPGSNLQLWNFQNTPTQITPPQDSQVPTMNMRADNLAGTVEWSGDSRYLARLTPSDQNEQIEVYNPRNLARLYTMTVVDTPSGINNPQTGQNTGLATVSNGLAWSQDGRYIALIRGYTLDSSGSANNYISGSEGEIVTVLEVPDLTKLATRTTQAQAIPNAQPTNSAPVTATPGGRRNTQTGATNLTVSPTHLQTLTLTGLGDANTAGGRNLVWSKTGRLLVLGVNLTTENNVVSYQYKAQTLDLTTSNADWKWQASDAFDLPFDSPHNFVAWSPDNSDILYNTTRDQLGLATIPDGSQKITTSILSQGTSNFYYDYYPSPDGLRYLQPSSIGDKYVLQVKDSATNGVLSELALPDGAMQSINNAVWSPDGKMLAIPFLALYSPTTYSGRVSPMQEIIRVWRVGEDQKLSPVGDLLVGSSESNYFNFPQTVSWDTAEGSQAVFFQTTDGKIGRWDVTKQLPSLSDQRSSISTLTTGNYDPASTVNFPYYELYGQVPGVSSGGGVGNWIWLPDHKHVIYCSSNCYIQELVAPGATPTTDQYRGIKFDPAPYANTAYRNGTNVTLKVSPDGRMVAVALASGLVNLYDTASGKLFSSFTAHQGSINSLNFSPDGKYLVTAGSDRAVKVWDTNTWRNLSILRLIEPSSDTGQVRWLADNKTLALQSSSGNTLLWRSLP